MNRSVSHRSLLACAVVGIGLSIVSCGPTRFAGNITSVVETPDAAADETVDVPGAGDPADAVDAAGAGDAGSTDDAAGDGAASTDSPCLALCAVLAGTSCAPDPAACPAGCEAQIADVCGAESRALLSCQAGLSSADFSCDSRGHLVMDAAKCQTESDALVLCLAGL